MSYKDRTKHNLLLPGNMLVILSYIKLIVHEEYELLKTYYRSLLLLLFFLNNSKYLLYKV